MMDAPPRVLPSTAHPGRRAITAFTPRVSADLDTMLRVLLVEDSPADAMLFQEMLDATATDDGPRLNVVHVERLSTAQTVLAHGDADVVLLDLTLPDGRGPDSYAAILTTAPDVPVIVLTGLADDALAVAAVRAGAQDYLVKGRIDGSMMRRAIRHAVERQRLVRELRHAMQARDDVLAIVSHDLRDPLGRIMTATQALLDPDALPPADTRRMLEVIARSAESMRRLIADLLDAARIETHTLSVHEETVPVAPLLETAVALHAPVAERHRVALVALVDGTLPPICGDVERLQQALGNLLGNAIQFTSPGGTITLEARPADGGRVVRFSVTDTGCGIAEDVLPHVFDRFWQARTAQRGGAGLGLAITKGIVEAHGGTITVTSTVGQGTTFAFTIPVDHSRHIVPEGA